MKVHFTTDMKSKHFILHSLVHSHGLDNADKMSDNTCNILLNESDIAWFLAKCDCLVAWLYTACIATNMIIVSMEKIMVE